MLILDWSDGNGLSIIVCLYDCMSDRAGTRGVTGKSTYLSESLLRTHNN